jgi:hypothetical protein
MSINPDNRIGVSTTIVGYVATDPRSPAYDRDGSKGVIEVPIAHNEGYSKDGEFVKTGTTWYSITAGGDAAADLKRIKKGDKVRVDDAKQEVREYKDADGNPKLGITLRFGKVTVLESKAGTPAVESDPVF